MALAVVVGIGFGGFAAFVGNRGTAAVTHVGARAHGFSPASLSDAATLLARRVPVAHPEAVPEATVVSAPSRAHVHHHHSSDADREGFDSESQRPVPPTPAPLATRVEQSDPTLPFPSPVAQQRAHNEISRRVNTCAAHLDRLLTVRVRYEGATGEPVAIGIDDPTLAGTEAEACLHRAVRAVAFDPFGQRAFETTLHLFVH